MLWPQAMKSALANEAEAQIAGAASAAST